MCPFNNILRVYDDVAVKGTGYQKTRAKDPILHSVPAQGILLELSKLSMKTDALEKSSITKDKKKKRGHPNLPINYSEKKL